MPEPTIPPADSNVTPIPSSTPPGTTGGEPTWRAPATAGRWAGKTAEEVLGIADTLYGMVEAGETRAQPPVAAPAGPDIGVADDEYVSGAQLKRIIAAATGRSDTGIELAASGNLGVVQQQHASDFAKYGPEINALIARIPTNLRTIDNLKQVVRMVRSDHIDEIANERAQQLARDMAPTLRSSGAAGSDVPVAREQTLESEKIPAEWKKRALAAGVTERVVEDFCRANDMTTAAFYKQFDTPPNRIVEDISQRRAAATG